MPTRKVPTLRDGRGADAGGDADGGGARGTDIQVRGGVRVQRGGGGLPQLLNPVAPQLEGAWFGDSTLGPYNVISWFLSLCSV